VVAGVAEHVRERGHDLVEQRRVLVLDELDGPEEAGAADVADDGQGPQLAEARRGTRAERKFLADVRAGLFTSYRS
jgi:hypothetical protein